MKNEIVEQVKSFIRQPHEMGYPKALIMHNCEPLCHACAKANFKLIVQDTKDGCRGSWQAGGVSVFWEGAPMQCCNCPIEIESAYGDPDAEEE
jgi:hypothetical protein